MKWPPRSPDFIPYNSCWWGCVKGKVFVPLVLLDVDALKLRISTAVETIGRNALNRV